MLAHEQLPILVSGVLKIIKLLDVSKTGQDFNNPELGARDSPSSDWGTFEAGTACASICCDRCRRGKGSLPEKLGIPNLPNGVQHQNVQLLMTGTSASPLLEFSAIQIVLILNRCFEGYLMPVQFSAEAFERRFRTEHLDACSSFVYLKSDQPLGIILVARRGNISRIAAMGVSTEARGQGLGRLMLTEALAAARDRGDQSIRLEVFEQNTRALGLYQSLGFEVTRRLIGYQRPDKHLEGANLIEIDALEFSRVATLEAEPDLPWQLMPENFAGQMARAFQLENAAFALVSESGSSFFLWGLVVRKAFRLKGYGRRLLDGLTDLFAGKECRIIQVVPEDLASGFFSSLGFLVLDLKQFEMRHSLSGK
jgi:ribosomal protein S18 acetylase RimI-like enzyme